MAEQKIDGYPEDKKMGFLTCSDLRKRSSVFLSISLVFDGGEEWQVMNQVMIQTLFQQKTYYCIIPSLILYQKLQRGNHFSNQFLSIYAKWQSPATFKTFCYSSSDVLWKDLRQRAETETQN